MLKRPDIVLAPVRPNVGIQVAYRKKLDRLIKEMSDSVEYWILAAYRNNEPEIVGAEPKITMAFDALDWSQPFPDPADMALDDALPANALKRAFAELAKRWQSDINDTAPKLAKWFAKSVQSRSQRDLKRILKDGGFTVKFRMTRPMQDIMRATIEEQVGLIKSIPQQYLTEVQGLVMRSVTRGRDIGGLTKDLRKRYGITKRRAALIARDQNNKATASMTRARQADIGIKQAVWLHSHAGKTPRPTHVKMDGKRYDVAKGMWDPAVNRFIFPGELINCRCVSKAVVAGFS